MLVVVSLGRFVAGVEVEVDGVLVAVEPPVVLLVLGTFWLVDVLLFWAGFGFGELVHGLQISTPPIIAMTTSTEANSLKFILLNPRLVTVP